MSTRRDFLLQTAATGGALVLGASHAPAEPARAVKPLRILILGATGFIGPHHVRAALARGHRVAAFIWNREKGPIDLPSSVERLVGDRNSDLESIKNRDWDAVIDLATFGPGWVRSLGEVLKGRVGHYTFISTISAYGVPAPDNVTEEGPVLAYQGKDDPYSITTPGPHYGALKVLCEREAQIQFPGRTLALRPGYIVGPGDRLGVLTYWPARMEKGGEVMVAGDSSTPVQFIDVRDLAEWIIRLIEKGTTGIFNAVGPAPADSLNLGRVLNAAAQGAAPPPSRMTWVPASWLAGRADKDIWGKLLFWTSEPGGYAGTMRINVERAFANGLSTRPLSDTLAGALNDYKQQQPQLQIATRVRKKAAGSTGEITPISWSSYLEYEKQALAAWRSKA